MTDKSQPASSESNQPKRRSIALLVVGAIMLISGLLALAIVWPGLMIPVLVLIPLLLLLIPRSKGKARTKVSTSLTITAAEAFVAVMLAAIAAVIMFLTVCGAAYVSTSWHRDVYFRMAFGGCAGLIVGIVAGIKTFGRIRRQYGRRNQLDDARRHRIAASTDNDSSSILPEHTERPPDARLPPDNEGNRK